MKNSSVNKLKKIKLNKREILKKPLKVLKKINLNSFKKITSFSLNKTFDDFKEKIKQVEIDRIKAYQILGGKKLVAGQEDLIPDLLKKNK